MAPNSSTESNTCLNIVDEVKAMIDECKAQVNECEARVEVLKGDIEVLKQRSDYWVQHNQEYREFRHRFLNTIKWYTSVGKSAPSREDAASDAVADALLYTTGENLRTDARLMVMAYGFLPETILLLSKLLPCLLKY